MTAIKLGGSGVPAKVVDLHRNRPIRVAFVLNLVFLSHELHNNKFCMMTAHIL